MTREGENVSPTEPGQCGQGCWSRLAQAPWGRLVVGEDPAPFALLLLFALLLMPLFEGLWPAIALALLVAFLVRAWLWCRGSLPADASAEEETESLREGKGAAP